MSAESDISGFLQRMHQVEQRVIDAAANALAVVAEDIITEAKRRCPLDTGDLQKSHYSPLSGNGSKPVEVSSNSLQVTFGANATYAAVVHENLEQPLKTDKNAAAEHKWLENAINARREKGLEYIAAKISEAESSQ